MAEDIQAHSLRILVLTKNPVSDGVGGELLMHRHIKASPPAWQFYFHHLGDGTIQTSPFFRRLHHGSRRRERLLNAWDACNGTSVRLTPILELCARVKPHLLYTIADGPLTFRVRQAAGRLGLPWVAQLNDWFPGGLDTPDQLEPLIAKAYLRLMRDSTRLLCFSEEIREAAASLPQARVLYPIPEPFTPIDPVKPETHALFAGRFDHFLGPEMKSLLRAVLGRDTPNHLRIIGPNADWDDETHSLVRGTLIYQGMKKGRDLHRELASASCLLVLAPFGEDRSHIARYSFPSKIPEYCQHDRPILVWGPKESSSIRWAQRTGAALIVDSPDPQLVLNAIERLSQDTQLVSSLTTAAGQEARTRFQPQALQNIFETTIREAISSKSPV